MQFSGPCRAVWFSFANGFGYSPLEIPVFEIAVAVSAGGESAQVKAQGAVSLPNTPRE
jgi:hypothetical protein